MLKYKNVIVSGLCFSALVLAVNEVGEWSQEFVGVSISESEITPEYIENAGDFNHSVLDIHGEPVAALAVDEEKIVLEVSDDAKKLENIRYVSLKDNSDLSDISPSSASQFSPETVKLVHHIEQLSQLVEQFRLMYGGIPGDISGSEKMSGKVVELGDGDGRITDVRESFLTWRHLAQAGLLELDAANEVIDFDDFDLLRSIPHLGVEDMVALPIYVPDNSASAKHMLMLSSLVGNEFSGGALTPSQAREIDLLIDDGIASTGGKNVPHGGVLAVNAGGDDEMPCVIDGNYNLTHDDKSCKLYVGMSF